MTNASLQPIRKILWAPQPGPQTLGMHDYREVKEVFMGGSRGPGKTDFLIGDYLQDVEKWGAAWRGFFCRRSYPELEEVMVRCQEIMGPWAKWTEKNKTWTFPNGAFLRLRFMENDKDWMRYQGHQYPWQGWDELPQHPNISNYEKMLACLRSAHGAPTRARSSGNPGCPGQIWVKHRFIDPAPPGKIIKVNLPDGSFTTRVFVKATVYDNKILLDKDPNYLSWLKSLPRGLRQAWLDGDWENFIGQMFSFVPRYHVVNSGQWPPPDHAQIFTSMDWGYAAPFDIGWYWTDTDGTIYRAREWYGWNGQPNQGARLSNVEIAQGIRRREEDWGIWGKVAFRIGGRDCFNKTLIPKTGEYGPTYNEDFMSVDGALGMIHANDSQASAGIAQCHERLRIEFDENGEMVTQPKFKVYSECKHFLRTVPTLVCDANNVEVVDDSQEDHAYHAWRNALMSRPLALNKPVPKKKGPARIIELASRIKGEYDDETYYPEGDDKYGEGAAW